MKDMTRRDFLCQAGAVTVVGLSGGVLIGCGGGQADRCSDLSGLTEEEKAFRKTNGYVDKTLIDARRCDNCNFWVKPADGSACGGCTLLKGPVKPEGYCNLWAKPVPEGAAAEPDQG